MVSQLASPTWDKMDFSYQAADSNQDVSLPLKLLVLGNFSGLVQEDIGQPTKIDKKSFDKVLASMNIEIAIEIAIEITSDSVSFLDFDINISSLNDFEPQSLVYSIDYLRTHVELITKLESVNSNEQLQNIEFSELAQSLMHHCGIEQSQLDIKELPFVIFDLNEHLHQILSEVLHNERFQQVESAWRNLHFMVSDQSAEQSTIEIIDVSKETLEEDFEANRDITETALYDIVYLNEFAQFGGQPYSALISDYYFTSGAQDLQLLKSIAKVCRLAHAPFIAGASPTFFNEDSFSQLENISDIAELINSPKYIKWRSFQKELDSAYIGLALPRIKLREAYNLAAGSLGAIPFTESVGNNVNHSLYGNASFAFANCLINSFAKYSVCTDLTGQIGGAVNVYKDSHGDSTLYPDFLVEATISERQLIQLANLGFITLAFNRATDTMFFTSSASIRWGHFANTGTQHAATNIGTLVEAQLPYIFIVSRIVHYLKVVQRESIGAQKSLIQVQSELNKWLKRYVSDVENPAEAIRARKPLKKAQVVLSEPDMKGAQSLELTIVPHLRFMGKDFSLSLTMSAE